MPKEKQAKIVAAFFAAAAVGVIGMIGADLWGRPRPSVAIITEPAPKLGD